MSTHATSIEDSYNFRRVSERVTSSGVVGAARLKGLGAEGYNAVINLLPDDSEYAVEGEAAIVEDQGIAYVHIPVDFAAPTRADLQAFAEAMDHHDGKTIHVHCAANFRVTAFYGLYALGRGLQTAEEADDLVGGVWNLAEHPVWDAFIADERSQLEG
ncbi:MAG: protein tyrosine phosphatase (PTP) superfamily phosphohydrolase (DUF442 family) [Candidatus Poriferisodalaceae bacterium]|jgi:protein tyrosine phosphatase (PTP) superfamily phosphohydrolase (DUF442 family)